RKPNALMQRASASIIDRKISLVHTQFIIKTKKIAAVKNTKQARRFIFIVRRLQTLRETKSGEK
ncbi:MAG TPA: hypothetical protein VJB68_03815, partial [Methylophilaceae bacterium]|nr:hypothetical protein [Methylophilaceae bacterium]